MSLHDDFAFSRETPPGEADITLPGRRLPATGYRPPHGNFRNGARLTVHTLTATPEQ
ncbi:hypothetical protein ACGFNX_15420 [Streptomyces sp. NPDC048723]|uniref:hypothetical protein n=1 Tax=Streptomyces sp. NPDC048723 TaxID=3365589 RepID=UPI0037191777